ncbi:hypothetical protein [Fundidesulfovibrio terrae]|uniref:hypothetical protein n=1 Tax=Fundidesulfovibrio terrae TaxID=2922866 RepID=UPI001FAF7468|nr:hypothetical protein [Fundidesulfovibrio terrae]
MSERSEGTGFEDYAWTDDVKNTFADRESNWDAMLTPKQDSSPQVGGDGTASDPDTPVIRAPREGEGGWQSRMPYNKYMENPFVQILSGFGKGIVRGVGLEVHPSLDYDTPVEETVSDLTKTWHPGLNVPKALTMTALQASGQPLTPEQQRTRMEGVIGTASGLLPVPAKQVWDVWDTGTKIIDSGKSF